MIVQPEVDPMTMRRTIGRFATGVAVVTTEHDGVPHGMTVNSLTSVSLEPPLLLVCLTTGARTTDAVVGEGRFAVNVLSARQEEIAMRFARRGSDHFEGLSLEYGEHSVPVVPDALAHLECTVERHFEAGDHVVVFGHVRHTCDRPGAPLAFLGGRFGDLAERGSEPVHWFF
ncbi:flavin reductase family protein [Amycolatopsis acidiphila]|uniref:Flavin reductase family protein n=1 Tax=Amycolatopsis acidiphila TaxID=715473 RepID=A0A558AIF2_9PSEU|nr:flavin reductase family protein [Amycolatopsis acidiphila]TVT24044.1 flavin reductase family protein [Amycolatopsis acidiphila]UIJ57809.1 flavin reductase family protein [Amycolatopsis acidiphila]GHG87804.1 oxidoreductase [Amycolatopsis acidiphila]